MECFPFLSTCRLIDNVLTQSGDFSLSAEKLPQRSWEFQRDCLLTQEGMSTKYSLKKLAGGHNPIQYSNCQTIPPQFLRMLKYRIANLDLCKIALRNEESPS